MNSIVGRSHGFSAGLNGDTFVSRRGKDVEYRLSFAMGYCEGVELRVALERL